MGVGDTVTTVAIVAAGGSGTRLNASQPKQFLELAGKPLLAHTVARFVGSPDIDRIVVVLPIDGFDRYVGLMTPWFGEGAPLDMVPGGESRQDSVWNGISTLASSFEGWVVVHDGARPLVTEEVIRDVVEAGKRFGGALAGLPVEETLKEVDAEAAVQGTIDRSRYYRAQTPQCFRHRILREAFERAIADGFSGTDEAQLVERIGATVQMVPGSVKNLKVTTREHLALAAYYLKLEEQP